MNFEIALPEEYGFFPRFYITAYFMTVVSIGLLIVLWAPIAYFYFLGDVRYGPALRASAYLTATFLLLAVFGRIIRRELGKVRFIVSGEGIARSDPHRQTAVRWHEIKAIRCRKLPLIKGFVEVITERRKLLLPSTITGFASLGRALRRGLERTGNEYLLDDAKARTISDFGLVSERWNERARKTLRPFIFATVFTTLFNLLIASRLWGMAVFPSIIWIGFGLTIPLVSYGIADVRLTRRLEKTLADGKVAEDEGSDVQLSTALIVGLAFGILGIVFKAIFQP